jgi:hypothetical protein
VVRDSRQLVVLRLFLSVRKTPRRLRASLSSRPSSRPVTVDPLPGGQQRSWLQKLQTTDEKPTPHGGKVLLFHLRQEFRLVNYQAAVVFLHIWAR